MRQIKRSHKNGLRALIGCLMLLPGLILWAIYKAIVSWYPALAVGLISGREAIAGLVATSSFTMLGFLATVVTILFAVSQSQAYRLYVERDFASLFFTTYFATIVVLFVSAGAAVFNLSAAGSEFAFIVMMVFFTNACVLVAIVTFILCNLARRSTQDQPSANTGSENT